MFGGRLDASELSEPELGENSPRRMVPVSDTGPQARIVGIPRSVDDGPARFSRVSVPVHQPQEFVGEFGSAGDPVPCPLRPQ